MKHWISTVPRRDRVILAFLVTVAIDILVIRPWERLMWNSLDFVTYYWSVPLWLAIPHLVAFTAAGFAFAAYLRASKIESLIYVVLVLVYYEIFSPHWMISNMSLLSLAHAYLPTVGVPACFVVGYLVGLRRLGAGTKAGGTNPGS